MARAHLLGQTSNVNQMVSFNDDDLAGLEEVGSGNEDSDYEPELSDSEVTGPRPGNGANRKGARAESGGSLPLMEGEGRSLRVLGFNQDERAAFLQILMRFGVGEYGWNEFVPHLKQKSHEEIRNYGMLFLVHISEDLTDSPHFADGVPKEGIDIEDVLVRIATLMLFRDKLKWVSENPGVSLFPEDIVFRYPGLKGRRFWREEHDGMLLRAMLKHGYGRWHAIVDDEELRFQELICQELNLPILNLPVGEKPSMSNTGPGTSEAAANLGQQVPQDSTALYHSRGSQIRRQLEFNKRRVLLLEKGLNAECKKEYYGEAKTIEAEATEPGHKHKSREAPVPGPMALEIRVAKSPQLKPIARGEMSMGASGDDTDQAELARLFTKMCRVVDDNAVKVAEAAVKEPPTTAVAGGREGVVEGGAAINATSE